MDNLSIYNALRKVPEEAKRPISGGRLKGKTDINPMWRIKSLTEQFGPCGIGWYTEIVRQWIEPGAGGELAAFCHILLFVREDGEWSKPIVGVGGSMLAEKESSGLHTNDECFKMAYTDAISVACKALGMGADVYWEKDPSKYTRPPEEPLPQCKQCGTVIRPAISNGEKRTAQQVAAARGGLCKKCFKSAAEVSHV